MRLRSNKCLVERHDDTLVSFRGTAVTRDSDTARAPWELFVRRGFRWKLIHDPKSESSRNKRGLDFLEEPDEDEFAADVPKDPKNVSLIA